MPRFRKKNRLQLFLQQKQQSSFIFMMVLLMGVLGAIPIGLYGMLTNGDAWDASLLVIGLLIVLGSLQVLRNAHKRYLENLWEDIRQRPKQILLEWQQGKQHIIITKKGLLWLQKDFWDFDYLKQVEVKNEEQPEMIFIFERSEDSPRLFRRKFKLPKSQGQKAEAVRDQLRERYFS